MRMASKIQAYDTLDLMNQEKLEEELKMNFDQYEASWIDITICKSHRKTQGTGMDSQRKFTKNQFTSSAKGFAEEKE